MDDRYREALTPITVISVPGGVKFRAECNSCGAHEEWRVTSVPGADVAQRHFTVRGWTLKRRAICPQCHMKKKEPKPMKPTPKDEPSASNADLALDRRLDVIEALLCCYDRAQRRYSPGHSDQTVSKELGGIAPDFIAKVREENFGKMAEPSEITDIRTKLAELTAANADLSAKLDKLATKNGWRT